MDLQPEEKVQDVLRIFLIIHCITVEWRKLHPGRSTAILM